MVCIFFIIVILFFIIFFVIILIIIVIICHILVCIKQILVLLFLCGFFIHDILQNCLFINLHIRFLLFLGFLKLLLKFPLQKLSIKVVTY